MRTLTHAVAVAGLIALSACQRNTGAGQDDLYTGRAFVTGQDERFRADGFTEAFDQVLAKVTGDPSIANDTRLAALTASAASLVQSFAYHDRMEGLPIGDEQGTRDRPFDLFVTFKRQAIDDTVRGLGRQPWTQGRPRVAVFLSVNNHGREYMLASDGELGRDQRDALTEAAWRFGLPVVLPAGVAVTPPPLSGPALLSLPVSEIEQQAKALGGDAALTGAIVWADGFVGWHAEWRLAWKGSLHRWTIRDVSFDEAFRNAIGGAARILSGHGDPASG